MKILARFFAAILACGALCVSMLAQSQGTIRTVVGNGIAGFSGDGGPATAAQINRPEGIAFDAAGNMYIADTENHRIRKVTPAGAITTIAGTGSPGYSGDGGPAISARLYGPTNIVLDLEGNLYISDPNAMRIRKVTPDGKIWTVAVFSFERAPGALAVDSSGSLYVADYWSGWLFDLSPRVYKVTPAGLIVVPDVKLCNPSDLAFDSADNLYIADVARVLKVTPGGLISTVAGNGQDGYGGDGGPATSAQLCAAGLAVDTEGALYISDWIHQRIRKVTPDGLISTVAGDGTIGYSGDGGPALSAQLNCPGDLAFDPAGNLYILDMQNNRVRRVEGFGSVARYFPQIVVGGGWSTLFTISNTGSATASGRLVLTDQQGRPLTVNGELTDASGATRASASASAFTFEVPSGGTVFLSVATSGSGQTAISGWGRLEASSDFLSALATCEFSVGDNTLSMVGLLPVQPVESATIPVDNDWTLGKQVVYAVANPGRESISVRLTLVGQDGMVVDDSKTVAIGPGEQVARYLWRDLGYAIFRGSLVMRGQNGKSFVAVGLLEKQGHFTVIPLIRGKAPIVPD